MVLQKMRAGAQGVFAKVLVGLIVFVLAVTGFGAIQFFSGGEPIAASVNGDDITQRMLKAETSRHRAFQRSQFGEDVSEELLDRLVDRRAVLESLIVNTLIGQFAHELDLSVSERTVLQRIRESFAGVEGFDDAMYRNWLAGIGHTPTSYQAEQAARILQSQVSASLGETGFVTKRETSRSAQILSQRRDIAYLLFDIDSFAAEVDVTEDEIETHYGDFIDDYMTEERFDFDYVRVLRAPVEAEIVVEEEAIEIAYQDEIAALPEPRRQAAHILLGVNDERSAAEARSTLLEVRSDIEAGASFEERARELSEDPSAEDGGDLGLVGRDALAETFADVLWALSPGEVSEPVETEYGVHLIKLVAVEDVEIATLDERRDEIAAQLRREEGGRRFDELVREVDELAFEDGDTLDGLRDRYGVEIEAAEGVTRRSSEGIFAEAAVRQAAFGDEVIVEGYNSSAVETEAAAVVVRLRTRHPPTERPLDEVRDTIRDTLALGKARELTERAAFDALTSFADGATPAEIEQTTGLDWQRADGVERGDATVPGEILSAAFEMAAPPDGERASDVAALATGSRALVLLSNVSLGDYGAMTESDRTALGRSLEQLVANQDIEAVIRTLRADASISSINFGTP